jgi:hypothetical protein
MASTAAAATALAVPVGRIFHSKKKNRWEMHVLGGWVV